MSEREAQDQPVDSAPAQQAGAGSQAARGGLGRVVEAGMQGESVSARGILEAIGGWRGIAETLVPATVYLVLYVITRDARLSAIAPLILAVAALVIRLVRKEPSQGAFAGLIGVGVCVAAVMFTGSGSSYFVPGFWINGAWLAAHTISLLVGWPLIGLLLGFLSGSLTEWRKSRTLKRAAILCTLLWIAMFAARLAVQLPLFFAAETGTGAAAESATEALGVARLLMGTPLFALAGILTWLVLSRVSAAVQASKEAIAAKADDQQSSDD